MKWYTAWKYTKVSLQCLFYLEQPCFFKKRCIDEKQIVEIKWKGGKEQQKTKNKEEKRMQIAL